MKPCKKCGKEIPDFLDTCNECAEKHFMQKTNEGLNSQEKPTNSTTEKNSFSDELRDGGFQKGLNWRKNKLEAIYRARKAGMSDEQILKELRLGGITIQKARELMRESEELLGR
jgi:ribosome-binding protein aMBF1 (putative translation factor)